MYCYSVSLHCFFCFDCNLLKIWSMNKFTRGPRCLQLPRSSTERKNAFHQTTTEALTGTIRGRDVHLIIEGATYPNWDDNCAFYYHRTGELITLPCVTLKVLKHDIFTVTPVKVLAPGFSFAPLGLTNMQVEPLKS